MKTRCTWGVGVGGYSINCWSVDGVRFALCPKFCFGKSFLTVYPSVSSVGTAATRRIVSARQPCLHSPGHHPPVSLLGLNFMLTGTSSLAFGLGGCRCLQAKKTLRSLSVINVRTCNQSDLKLNRPASLPEFQQECVAVVLVVLASIV